MTDAEVELERLKKEMDEPCRCCGATYRTLLDNDFCCRCHADRLQLQVDKLRAYLTVIYHRTIPGGNALLNIRILAVEALDTAPSS